MWAVKRPSAEHSHLVSRLWAVKRPSAGAASASPPRSRCASPQLHLHGLKAAGLRCTSPHTATVPLHIRTHVITSSRHHIITSPRHHVALMRTGLSLVHAPHAQPSFIPPILHMGPSGLYPLACTLWPVLSGLYPLAQMHRVALRSASRSAWRVGRSSPRPPCYAHHATHSTRSAPLPDAWRAPSSSWPRSTRYETAPRKSTPALAPPPLERPPRMYVCMYACDYVCMCA